MARGEPFHEKEFFQYFVILLIVGAFVFSLLAFINVYQLKKELIPSAINVNDFLEKLTAHDEMKAYIGTAPLNIVQVNQNNIANLQAQIQGLDASYIGDFIVQYSDAVVIYNYDNDEVKGTLNLQQPQAQLPDDFFAKLNKHAEVQGLENEQPVGGQLDEASLETLKQQFPDVYADAKVGDFLLRYQAKLVIYDYNSNRIINAVNLQ